MADIAIRRSTTHPGCMEITINGIDLTDHVYGYPELVLGGEGDSADVCLQVTLGISRLDLDGEERVAIPGRFPEVAQRVHDLVHGKDA